MTREQATKLIELIDAKIAEHAARDSSDGGLIESSQIFTIHKELMDLCDDE